MASSSKDSGSSSSPRDSGPSSKSPAPGPGVQLPIRWPIRYQPEDFRGKKAFVIIPRTESDATRSMTALVQTAKERLGFEESDLQSANFIIVGDGTRGTPQPNKRSTDAIIDHSHKNNEMPILSVSLLEMYQHLLDVRAQQSGSEAVEEEGFTLQEEIINGRMTLTMGEDFFRYAARNEDKAYDKLGRQQLLKDDFVEYVGTLPDDEKKRLGELIDTSPLRLVGTRWKVHMVLNRYLSLAWELTENTWTFVFKEEEFSEECANFFGTIMPDDALRACVLAFLQDHDIYFS